MVRFLSVVGTRPQYMKMAVVQAGLSKLGLSHDYIDTGQHYSKNLSSLLVNDLGLSRPLRNLEIGSGSHAEQITRVILGLEEHFLVKDHWAAVLVYGDTNSTLGAAIIAKRMGLKVVHVESGLRSFDNSMPEELNRKMVDQISDLLLCPTETSMKNLSNEGLSSKAKFVGDTSSELIYNMSLTSHLEYRYGLEHSRYICATIHRPSNTDNRERLSIILSQLASLDLPVLIPAHPRLQKVLHDIPISSKLKIIDGVEFSQMIHLLSHSAAIVTDSGGLQKEAYMLRIPCTTIRSSTEWPETLIGGWNVLCDSPSHLLTCIRRMPPTIYENYFSNVNVGVAIGKILGQYQWN